MRPTTYRFARFSRRHCISDTAIHKCAKAENWSLRTPESPAAKPPSTLAQTKVQTHNEDFRWEWEPENEEIVVPEQLAFAIYRNPWGQVIIRQQRFIEEDVYVRLNAESCRRLPSSSDCYARSRLRMPLPAGCCDSLMRDAHLSFPSLMRPILSFPSLMEDGHPVVSLP